MKLIFIYIRACAYKIYIFKLNCQLAIILLKIMRWCFQKYHQIFIVKYIQTGFGKEQFVIFIKFALKFLVLTWHIALFLTDVDIIIIHLYNMPAPIMRLLIRMNGNVMLKLYKLRFWRWAEDALFYRSTKDSIQNLKQFTM